MGFWVIFLYRFNVQWIRLRLHERGRRSSREQGGAARRLHQQKQHVPQIPQLQVGGILLCSYPSGMDYIVYQHFVI